VNRSETYPPRMATATHETAPSDRERRVRKLLVAVVVIGALVGAAVAIPAVYFSGGGRLQVGGGFSSGPAALGEELHLVQPITPVDGAVELRSTRVVAADGLDVQIELVRLPAGEGGTFRGPVPEGYEPVPLEGQTITPDDDERYALHLTLVATELGEQPVELVEVTYEAGRFRTRTSKLREPVCIRGVEEFPSPDSGPPSEGCAH
jgi:hypothetical protein